MNTAKLRELSSAVQQKPEDIGVDAACALYEAYCAALDPQTVIALLDMADVLALIEMKTRTNAEFADYRINRLAREALRIA